MQRKQNVTSRRYFVRKSSTTPDADSSALHGGFKYLSRFSGNSRPLNLAALLRICFTSLTRPLHRSQRGDSGTTNLSTIQNKHSPSLLALLSFRSIWVAVVAGQTSVLTICSSLSSPNRKIREIPLNVCTGWCPIMKIYGWTRVTLREKEIVIWWAT